MTKLQLNRPWPEVRDKLLEAEPMLTEEDLAFEDGNSNALLERLAARLGRSVEHVKGWVESVAFTDGQAG